MYMNIYYICIQYYTHHDIIIIIIIIICSISPSTTHDTDIYNITIRIHVYFNSI